MSAPGFDARCQFQLQVQPFGGPQASRPRRHYILAPVCLGGVRLVALDYNWPARHARGPAMSYVSVLLKITGAGHLDSKWHHHPAYGYMLRLAAKTGAASTRPVDTGGGRGPGGLVTGWSERSPGQGGAQLAKVVGDSGGGSLRDAGPNERRHPPPIG